MSAAERDPERPGVHVVIGRAATDDLREALRYLEERSTGAGRKLLRALDRKVGMLQRFPESAQVDARAEGLPFRDGARARSTQVSGYAIRYVYPVQIEGEAALLLVSIRHGRRVPIDDRAFMQRFLAELLRAGVQRSAAGRVSAGGSAANL